MTAIWVSVLCQMNFDTNLYPYYKRKSCPLLITQEQITGLAKNCWGGNQEPGDEKEYFIFLCSISFCFNFCRDLNRSCCCIAGYTAALS